MTDRPASTNEFVEKVTKLVHDISKVERENHDGKMLAKEAVEIIGRLASVLSASNAPDLSGEEESKIISFLQRAQLHCIKPKVGAQ